MDEKREQAAKQCDAVVYMAKIIADLHADRAKILRSGKADELIDMTGNRTAYLLETLGDVLNDMDAGHRGGRVGRPDHG